MASAISRTACSTASSVTADTDWTPPTLRTYCLAAASTSSGVADGLEAAEGGDVPAHGCDTTAAPGLLAQKRPSHVLTTGIGRFALLYS